MSETTGAPGETSTVRDTFELLKTLRDAELLLDERSDARAIDRVVRIVGEVRAELGAVDELSASLSLVWLLVERLEKRVGLNRRRGGDVT